MRFPFPGIGVVFDIDGLGGGYYGYRAWKIFMKNIDQKRLGVCILVEGDTAATLNGQANEFCIGVYGPTIDLSYIREIFEAINDPGLSPFHRRFIEKIVLDEQPLSIKGQLDVFNRLVTGDWTRIDHDLCKEAGWSYCPEYIPPHLEPSLYQELEDLKRPTFA